jgi:hypothetical protein
MTGLLLIPCSLEHGAEPKKREKEEKTAQPECVLTFHNLKHCVIMLQQIFSVCIYVEQCIKHF